jgi:WhiB family redox-sensing transcriptional regulator
MLPEVVPMSAVDRAVPAPPRWTGSAACADTDVEFFPLDDDGPEARPAKAMCAGCGVRQLCLAYALEWRMTAGIWGGRSTRDRESLLLMWPAEARRCT